MDQSNSNNSHSKDHPKYRSLLSTVGLINTLIVVLSLIISGWCTYDIISKPFLSLRVANIFIMTIGSALATNRTFAIFQRFVKIKKLRIGIGILKWPATFFIPLLCVSMLNNIANVRSVEITIKHLTPLIENIEHEQHKLKYPPSSILKGLQEIGKFHQITYYWGDKHFTLTTPGGSVDIDGSTIYYNSLTQKWFQIHNDLKSTEYGKLYRNAVEGLDFVVYEFKKGQWRGR